MYYTDEKTRNRAQEIHRLNLLLKKYDEDILETEQRLMELRQKINKIKI